MGEASWVGEDGSNSARLGVSRPQVLNRLELRAVQDLGAREGPGRERGEGGAVKFGSLSFSHLLIFVHFENLLTFVQFAWA